LSPGTADKAEEHAREAVAIQSSLAAQFPDVVSYALWAAVFRNALAETLVQRGKTAEARSLLEETVSMLTGLLDKKPDFESIHGILQFSRRNLDRVQGRRPQPEAMND
jgi:hypothetical protein